MLFTVVPRPCAMPSALPMSLAVFPDDCSAVILPVMSVQTAATVKDGVAFQLLDYYATLLHSDDAGLYPSIM